MTVEHISIGNNTAGQRIDNFLFTLLKGVPKSRIYRGIRKGEFRVNGGRIGPDYHLRVDDNLRIPPIRKGEPKHIEQAPLRLLKLIESRIVYEDKELMVLNKPSGIPVHGGSKISWGLIELLRALRSRHQSNALELIHRLDRATSGCLLIAKGRVALLEWHHLLTHRQVKKEYILLVRGQWNPEKRTVKLPLKKNVLAGGERIVTVDSAGKSAETHFKIHQLFQDSTLLSAKLVTGRTHQLRVHAAAMGHPIAGDEKYGDAKFNRMMRDKGLRRLFLHCSTMKRLHHKEGSFQGISAPLDQELITILSKMR